MAITRVQVKTNSGNGVNSIAATFDSNVTSGNLIVAILSSYYGDSTVGSAAASDTLTNSYATAVSVVDATNITTTVLSTYTFYALSGSGGANTVTIGSLSGSYVVLTIIEYSGMAAASVLDQANKFRQYSGGAEATYASGNVTTTQADELLIGAIDTLQASDIFTPDSGWSEVGLVTNGNNSHMVFERIVAATGTYNNTGGLSPSQTGFSVTIATFKGDGGGGGGAARAPRLNRFPLLGVH
jgi:hypothetical protein